MNRVFHGTCVLVVALVALGGCGRGEQGAQSKRSTSKAVAYKSADQPRNVLENMVTALLAEDRDTYMACFTGSAQELQVPVVLFDFSVAGAAFRADFIRAYGKAGWDKFQSESPGEANARLELPDGSLLAELDKATVTINGNSASMTVPQESKSVEFVKQADGWRINACCLVPSGAEPDTQTRMMRSMIRTITKYRKAIGHKGISGEDIDYELGREIVSQIRGGTINAPHRFDIDKL